MVFFSLLVFLKHFSMICIIKVTIFAVCTSLLLHNWTHVIWICHVFDSNVAAGKIFGIPLRGTHSHAFVSSFMVCKLSGFTCILSLWGWFIHSLLQFYSISWGSIPNSFFSQTDKYALNWHFMFTVYCWRFHWFH